MRPEDVQNARCRATDRYGNVCGGGLVIKPNGPHQDAVCSVCDAHYDFVKQDGSKPRRAQSNEDIHLCDEVRRRARWCAFCGRRASRYEAHHSRALTDGGPEADLGNLIPLCVECHMIATAEQKRLRELRQLLRDRSKGDTENAA